MTDKKKTWTEPELIVLVRGNPEEAVLWVCKESSSGSGAEASAEGCNTVPDCYVCSGEAGS